MNINEPINVNEDSFDIAVLKAPMPVLVDFWATWCGPCKMIAPLLDEIAKEQAGKVRIAKVDIDQSPALGARYKVRGVPTLLFFRNGEVKDTVVGATGKRNIVSKLEALA